LNVTGQTGRNEANSGSTTQICAAERKVAVNLYTNRGAAAFTDAF